MHTFVRILITIVALCAVTLFVGTHASHANDTPPTLNMVDEIALSVGEPLGWSALGCRGGRSARVRYGRPRRRRPCRC